MKDDRGKPSGLPPELDEVFEAAERTALVRAVREVLAQTEANRVTTLPAALAGARLINAQAALYEGVAYLCRSLVTVPAAALELLTRGNLTAQTVLAVGVVMVLLAAIGVSIAEIDLTRILIASVTSCPDAIP